MNYEKFKRSDKPDRFRSLTTVNCQRFSLRCWGKVFQWLPKDWHKKFSDFCKMKFVHVHFAADWMNKFPNRGRYQIANIISWQNYLYCSQLSTSSVWKLTIFMIKETKKHVSFLIFSEYLCITWKRVGNVYWLAR
jgi:hypothetical protein